MKYRKKPVVVEAMQFTDETKHDCLEFVACDKYPEFGVNGKPVLHIHTLEGVMTASPGDYIIRGVKGEFYPCKPDIFEQTYEACEEGL